MKSVHAVIAITSLTLFLACGTKHTEPTVVSVSVSPTAVNVITGRTQQFTATVTGASNTAVNWTLAGAGCTGAACGSISGTGLYTAPATVPSPATVTVTATAQADTTKTAAAIVTLVPPPPVSVSLAPKSVNVLVSTTATFTPTVANTTNLAVTWTLTGTGCTGAACGTMNNGVYTAPAVVPNPATVTVTATSQADTSKSASATVTVVATRNALLSGAYAFRFTGFDASGALAEIGILSFTEAGTIGGQVYAQRATGSNAGGGLISAGSYTLGADGRGQFTITVWPAATHTYQFAYNQSGEIPFIAFDYSGKRGAGVLKKLEPTGLSGSTPLNGDYLLALDGNDMAGSRAGLVGRIHLTTGGGLSGAYDFAQSGVTGGGTLSGSYTLGPGGDGQAQMLGVGRTVNWRFVFVSKSEMFWIMDGTTDTALPLLSGVAREQTGGPFSNSSVAGNLVLALTGKSGTGSALELARISADSAGGFTGTRDFNDAGTLTTAATVSGAYTITSDGRGAFGMSGQQFVFYMAQPGELYLLQTGGAQTMTGMAEAQSGSFSNLPGIYGFGSMQPGSATATLRTGTTLLAGNSSLAGAVDTSTATTLDTGHEFLGQVQNLDATTGRAVVSLTSPGNSSWVLYAIRPGKFLLLPATSGAANETILQFSW